MEQSSHAYCINLFNRKFLFVLFKKINNCIILVKLSSDSIVWVYPGWSRRLRRICPAAIRASEGCDRHVTAAFVEPPAKNRIFVHDRLFCRLFSLCPAPISFPSDQMFSHILLVYLAEANLPRSFWSEALKEHPIGAYTPPRSCADTPTNLPIEFSLRIIMYLPIRITLCTCRHANTHLPKVFPNFLHLKFWKI